MYKFDISTNRPDLLCLEGLSRNLKQYICEHQELPKYSTDDQNSSQEIMIYKDSSVKNIRPVIICAALKDVEFDKDTLKDFMDYQTKLHSTICRDRKLVSIGTHDLDKIKAPFRYVSRKPSEISFHALKQDSIMRCDQLMDCLKSDNYLKNYLKILDGMEEYPFVMDSDNDVVSFPPIINGIK
ncbi:MAG: hypothetical protein MHMPM18_003800 [Marteilia pararefringens]